MTLLPRVAAEAEARHANLRTRAFVRPGSGRTLVLAWRRTAAAEQALRARAAAIREATAAAAGPSRR